MKRARSHSKNPYWKKKENKALNSLAIDHQSLVKAQKRANFTIKIEKLICSIVIRNLSSR